MPEGDNSSQTERESEVSKFKRKVEALQKQLTMLKLSLTNERLAVMDATDISVRLDYVEGLHATFESAQAALIASESSDDDIGFIFLTQFFEVKANLSRCMANKRNPQLSSTVRQFSMEESFSQRKLRLPELKIPQFNGSYTDWPGFFAMFKTVIDNDGDLSKIEKFQHLRVSVCGPALDTISSLDLTEENYDKALELLKTRFDNKLLNFQMHIREIFGLKVVDKGSAAGLRQLSDKLNSHMRALQTLCKPEELADGFLIYLVTSKLDANSQAKWEEDLPVNTLPKWCSMASFLERRCRMLENLESSMCIQNSKQQVSKKFNSSGRNALVTSTSPTNCALCDIQGHFITNCPSFEKLQPLARFKEAKRLHLCLNCLKKGHMTKKCKSRPCQHCSSKHHSLLHIENATNSPMSYTVFSSADEITSPSAQSALVSSSSSCSAPSDTLSSTSILLATAIIMVKNRYGTMMPFRAILDSASQLNFITYRAANMLQLKVNKSTVTISGIGDGCFVADKSVNLSIKSCHGDYSTSFTAVVVPTITDYQPNLNLNVSSWKIPQNVKLADPNFWQRGRMDILIGAGLFFELMCVGQIRLGNSLPVLQKTHFGWVVSGGVTNSSKYSSLAVVSKCDNNECLEKVLKSFWNVENNFEDIPLINQEDAFCEDYFQQTTVRLHTGEYSVRLPKRENLCDLGKSYEHALQRFRGLEKKLNRQPELKKQYVQFMNEYSALKHMSQVPTLPKNSLVYFLPHHCVLKEHSTTTKLRVVFDGSAKTTTGVSLNDVLFVGPTIQQKLFHTLLRFRLFKIALSGDISKMYRCVRMSDPDNYLQCILWRSDPADDIKIYKLDTVTYGTKPAAFLAMHQLSFDEEKSHPLGSQIIRRDFYGSHRGAMFLKFHDGTDITKTLGLMWDPKSDNFIFSFTPMTEAKTVTKRTILSSIARIYDPLGLIGPVITKAKIIMQTLWKHDLNWDESLPQELHSSWLHFLSQFSLLHKFMFPRFVSALNSSVQIHAFCDASLSAYGACVYVRAECEGEITTHLLCSKSRVAPLKVLTVPKLELSAAALLADLLESISKTLPTNIEYHCWSDSMVTLSWLREHPSNFNVFVSNRVSRIQSITESMRWHYVPTALNPSDILSRGASPEELLKSNLWKYGPDFLRKSPSNWPHQLNFISELPERRRIVLATSSIVDLSLNCKFYNSFSKMQRIFSYVYRFINKGSSKNKTNYDNSTIDDIKMGTHLLIRNIQRIYFANEYKSLLSNSNVLPSSKLFSLAPILDSFGLIRVGGRLENSFLDFDARHPIILPKNHPITKSMILYFHEKCLHAGPQCLLAAIRQQYWPLGGRKIVSSVISKCVRCFRLKPKLSEHIMGNLPQDRVRATCHMELVQDLSTPAFLMALKRFISLRGKPRSIWSDNATNFVGAKNELAELKGLFFDQSNIDMINRQCIDDGIEWKFIPPRSPHFGGLWEAAVKTVKYHFYRVAGISILTFDEMRTLVYQISAILNSRPLCPLSENPNDLEVLTPAHFLVGGPLVAFAEPDLTDLNINILNRWQKVSFMQQTFWKKWHSSYLSLLQERSKWRATTTNLTQGDMVLIKDENLPPLKWQLGRVSELIHGKDGTARVAVIKTSTGECKRAVTKLAVLPIERES
ncbi:uncharacterized protein LOC142222573 [Haematobia irritans]|uniref:uncharacterized protein LOC142222573 n=1 Tax=Haematobia irritans TaxID=7368 RepID=UPI003F507297